MASKRIKRQIEEYWANNADKIQQLAESVEDLSVDQRGALTPSLQELLGPEVVRVGVVGDGTCLIHAVLMCTDPEYRALGKYEKGERGREWRLQFAADLTEEDFNAVLPNSDQGYQAVHEALFQVGEFKDGKTEEPGVYLSEDVIQLIMWKLDINIVTLRLSIDAVYCNDRLDAPQTQSPIVKRADRPTIIIVNVFDGHFEAVCRGIDDYSFPYKDPMIKRLRRHYRKCCLGPGGPECFPVGTEEDRFIKPEPTKCKHLSECNKMGWDIVSRHATYCNVEGWQSDFRVVKKDGTPGSKRQTINALCDAIAEKIRLQRPAASPSPSSSSSSAPEPRSPPVPGPESTGVPKAKKARRKLEFKGELDHVMDVVSVGEATLVSAQEQEVSGTEYKSAVQEADSRQDARVFDQLMRKRPKPRENNSGDNARALKKWRRLRRRVLKAIRAQKELLIVVQDLAETIARLKEMGVGLDVILKTVKNHKPGETAHDFLEYALSQL